VKKWTKVDEMDNHGRKSASITIHKHPFLSILFATG